MAGIPSEALFELIKSLTPSEKRHFKIFASRNGEPGSIIYIQLFDAIEKQNIYDEKLVLKTVKNLKPEQASNQKKYLYSLILQSLELYNSSVSIQLRSMLNHVEILYDKGLYAQCKKIIDKIIHMADVYENYAYMHEAHNWTKKLIFGESFKGLTLEELEQELNISHSIVGKLKNATDLFDLQYKFLYMVGRTGSRVRNEQQRKTFDDLIKLPILSNEKNALTPNALRIYHAIQQIYYVTVKGDSEKAYYHSKKHLELLESKPKIIAENPDKYVAVLNNMLQGLLLKKMYPECLILIKKMRAIPQALKLKNSKTLEYRIFMRSYMMELDLYLLTAEFNKIHHCVTDIKHGLNKYSDMLEGDKETIIYYNVAYLYFGNNDYKQALVWLNKLFNMKDIDAKGDVYSFAKIIALIVQFELDKIEILPYVIKSTYRFLLKRGRVFKAEGIVIDFIRKLGAITSDRKLKQNYKEALAQFETLKDDPFEKNAFTYFDFISWFESKVTGVPFAEIVRKKL